jgi:hypothetical protein
VNRTVTVTVTLVALPVALLATGCDVLGPTDPLDEACDHLTAIATPVNATASSSSAPELATHTHYELTLPDVAGGRTGAVKFASTLRGKLLAFLSVDLPIELASAMGGRVAPSSSGKSGPCPELAAWYEYDVGVGTQTLTLGGPGNTKSPVGLVFETEADAL